jgi:putative DNA primase/helicase
MKKILGEFFVTVSRDVLIDSKSYRQAGAATPHLIPLIGKRFACISETKYNDNLDEKTIKTLTGYDELSVRANYGDQTTFFSTAKLMLITNHRPTFDSDDKSMVDRIRYIPFETEFVKTPTLPNERQLIHGIEELLNLDNVFAWMVEGVKKYYEHQEILVPQCLIAEKTKYVEENDMLHCFLEEKTERNQGDRIRSQDLWRKFQEWCRENGKKGMTHKQFSMTMKKKGYEQIRSNGMWFLNIKYNDDVINNKKATEGPHTDRVSSSRLPKCVDGKYFITSMP